MSADDCIILHIEVCQQSNSFLPVGEIEEELDTYFKENNEIPTETLLRDTALPSHIKYIRVFSSGGQKKVVNYSDEKVKKFFHIYQTWEDGPQVDSLQEENDEVPASLNWCLPNTVFEGLWESLILEDDLKERLMSYVETTLLYSSKEVNALTVHWNGVILLHGPPGTGKTSLCKALAQKLSIRLDSKYRTSQLVEINTHSLFSKWFSESPKLVLKLFTSVRQWLISKDHFVCILIDEVESLTYIRKASGTEPSDSIRVVNAVLTQIDQLQRYPNVLVLGTSNITNTIDLAFADRADLKICISYPSVWASYEILRSCVEELIRCDLVKGNPNDFFQACIFKNMNGKTPSENGVLSEINENSKLLLEAAEVCEGVSGRTLRKMPFLTSTKFINKGIPTVYEFLTELKKVIEKHKFESKDFQSNK